MASQLSRNRIKKVEKHWKSNIEKNIENNNGKTEGYIRGKGEKIRNIWGIMGMNIEKNIRENQGRSSLE